MSRVTAQEAREIAQSSITPRDTLNLIAQRSRISSDSGLMLTEICTRP